MNKKKIIYITFSAIFLIAAAGIITYIAKQDLKQRAANNQPKVTVDNSGSSANQKTEDEKDAEVKKEEADFKVKDKKDAEQALNDLNGMVNTAGNSSF